MVDLSYRAPAPGKRRAGGLGYASRGFSMVELMFALLIISIVILGAMSLLGTILRNQKDGRIYEKVSVVANEVFGRIGEALSEDFETEIKPSFFGDDPQPLEGITYEVLPSAGDNREDLKTVKVKFSWKDEAGRPREKVISTKFLRGE